jgi:hypothetical protein
MNPTSRLPARKGHPYSIRTDWVDPENDRQYDLTPVSALTRSYSHAKSPSGYSLDPWEVDDDDDDDDEDDEALPRPAPSSKAIGDASKELNCDEERYVGARTNRWYG